MSLVMLGFTGVFAFVMAKMSSDCNTPGMDAIATMRDFVLRSHSGGGIHQDVFKLDPMCSQALSRFKIEFTHEMPYGFDVNDAAFVAEWLDAYRSQDMRYQVLFLTGDTQ